MTNYKEITTIEEWKDLLSATNEKPVLLLKHSTTCPISANGFKEFQAFQSPIDTYLVKVIESRPVSNEITADLDIKHESPQVFLINKGKAIWQATHWKINGEALAEAVATL